MPGNVIIDGCDILTSTGGKWLRTCSAAGWNEILAPVAVDTQLLSQEEKNLLLFPRERARKALWAGSFFPSFEKKEKR